MILMAIVVSEKSACNHSCLSRQKEILLAMKKFFNLLDENAHHLRLSHSRRFQRYSILLRWLLQILVSIPTASQTLMGYLLSPVINLHDRSLKERSL
tara:strand:- start:6984 stop:7274 length:291 start_codon:yes stop_codon:yes gene_type:complete